MYLCHLYTLAFVSQPVLTWIPPPTQYQTENLASTDKKSNQKITEFGNLCILETSQGTHKYKQLLTYIILLHVHSN